MIRVLCGEGGLQNEAVEIGIVVGVVGAVVSCCCCSFVVVIVVVVGADELGVVLTGRSCQ